MVRNDGDLPDSANLNASQPTSAFHPNRPFLRLDVNKVRFGSAGGQLFTCPGQFGAVKSAAPTVSTLDEGRRHSRTHLFVAATLYSDVGSVPVNIRNMSPSGALIESSAIPDRGTAVILKRGSLQAAGRIAWKVERKAGVAFSTDVYVTDWMSRQAAPHQQLVEEIVSNFRVERRIAGSAEGITASNSNSIEAELLALQADLAQLSGSLVADTILVATHPEIQMLDISAQRVARILGQLRRA